MQLNSDSPITALIAKQGKSFKFLKSGIDRIRIYSKYLEH